ncbi:MAG: GntP family permease [Firmicutes bacterium]|nr:GntP family permease [Bacillota bacterium]
MLDGPILLGIFLVAIALIIFLTAKVKLHPFISLLIAAYFIGFAVRMDVTEIATTITGGFGNILAYIGIVIILGTIIGTILDKSGAAVKMAETVLRVVGRKKPALAMSIIGAIVSIPVFCDSGYVILTPLRKALTRLTNISPVTMVVALATGLYATHTLVPPTPGPIAAAGNLGLEGDLILIIFLGLLVSIPALIAGYIYAVWVGKKVTTEELSEDEVAATYDEMISSFGKLPSATLSFAPIVVPIFLMAMGSIVKFPSYPLGEAGTFVYNTFAFLGTPVNALFVGFLFALALLPKLNEETLSGWIGEGMKSAAVIIMVTGAGGALGGMLSATPIGDYLGSTLSSLSLGIFLPFIIAAALKTAQGSSTVALVTTSAMMAPMLSQLGFDSLMAKALVVMAIGAGAMTVSHANDSYFWVVTEFGGLKVETAYKAQTIATLIQGLVTVTVVAILAVFFI